MSTPLNVPAQPTATHPHLLEDDLGSEPREDVTAIQVRNLWQVFGPKAALVPDSQELAALSRAELLARTGCTAAVRDVSFDVGKGELFVIMGLSGSGKSTLVRCLTRLIEPTSGTVHLAGENICDLDDRRLRDLRRHRIAMVFQHFGLLPHRKVLDNVGLPLEVRGSSRALRLERAREVIELVGLKGYENSYPKELSGGMQQRVGVARALAGDPDLLFFDEPFSALDPLIRRDMQREVIRLHKVLGKTMVFVTHDLSEAILMGDRIVLLRDGSVVQMGTAAEIVANPADDYVRDFVSGVPKADVLTLRFVMREASAVDELDGAELGPDSVVQDAVQAVLTTGKPVKVVADGRMLGVVGAKEVVQVLRGEPA